MDHLRQAGTRGSRNIMDSNDWVAGLFFILLCIGVVVALKFADKKDDNLL
jgi:preprotein translocase subunit SecG